MKVSRIVSNGGGGPGGMWRPGMVSPGVQASSASARPGRSRPGDQPACAESASMAYRRGHRAPRFCSAARAALASRYTTPGPGTGHTWTTAGPRDQPACPGGRVDGLRRGHRHRGPVRGVSDEAAARRTWTGTGLPGPSRPPRPARLPRYGASMVYDAATGTVVLFGGYDGRYLRGTWTWNGSTWTKQAPATRPPARLTR